MIVISNNNSSNSLHIKYNVVTFNKTQIIQPLRKQYRPLTGFMYNKKKSLKPAKPQTLLMEKKASDITRVYR